MEYEYMDPADRLSVQFETLALLLERLGVIEWGDGTVDVRRDDYMGTVELTLDTYRIVVEPNPSYGGTRIKFRRQGGRDITSVHIADSGYFHVEVYRYPFPGVQKARAERTAPHPDWDPDGRFDPDDIPF